MDKPYVFLQFLSLFLTYAFVINMITKNDCKINQRSFTMLLYFFIIGLAISYPYYQDYKVHYFLLAICYPLIACIGFYNVKFKS